MSFNNSILLTPNQLDQWNRNGFLAIERVTSDDDISLIRKLIENLFNTKAGFSEGAHFNLVGKDADLDSTGFPQIVGPRHYAGELRNTEFFANASALAKQLLGPDVRYIGDHTLAKPAKNGPATPWHQDKETDRQKRMRAWMKKGGLFIATWRFFKEANPKDFPAIVAKLRLQITRFLMLWGKK